METQIGRFIAHNTDDINRGLECRKLHPVAVLGIIWHSKAETEFSEGYYEVLYMECKEPVKSQSLTPRDAQVLGVFLLDRHQTIQNLSAKSIKDFFNTYESQITPEEVSHLRENLNKLGV